MPGTTVTEEIIELIHQGKGPGGGAASGDGDGGGEGGGSGSSGGGRTPQRAYVTGMIVALA
jgi:hypothetical protein